MSNYLDRIIEEFISGPSKLQKPLQSPAPQQADMLMQALMGGQSPVQPMGVGQVPSGMQQQQIVGGQPGPMGQVGQAVGMGGNAGDLLGATAAYQNTQNRRMQGVGGMMGNMANFGEAISDAIREPAAREELMKQTQLASDASLQKQKKDAMRLIVDRTEALMSQGHDPMTAQNIAASSIGDHNFNLKDWKAPDDTADMKNLEGRIQWIKTPEGREWASRAGQDVADEFLATGKYPSKANLHYNVSTDTALNDPTDPKKGAYIIEGTKTHRDMVREELKDEQRAGSKALESMDVIGNLDQIEELVGPHSTGMYGTAVRDLLPDFMQADTDAYAIGTLLDPVRAKNAFGELNKMRQQSPTGGALGNVSNQELKLLERSVSALDPNLPPHLFMKEIQKTKRIYARAKWMMENEEELYQSGMTRAQFSAEADRLFPSPTAKKKQEASQDGWTITEN